LTIIFVFLILDPLILITILVVRAIEKLRRVKLTEAQLQLRVHGRLSHISFVLFLSKLGSRSAG
jgi:hypothetical protein